MNPTAIEFVAHGGGFGGRFLGPLLLLLVIGGLATWLIRRRRGGQGGDQSSALQTLKDRFARGEIDHAEFQHRQAVLVGADVVPPAPSRPSSSGAEGSNDAAAEPGHEE